MQSSVFKPAQEMTFTTVQHDCDRLRKYYRSNQQNTVVLDLSDVRLCDSAGLALLIEAKRLGKKKGKACQIIGMSKEILALAEFCGVDTILVCGTSND